MMLSGRLSFSVSGFYRRVHRFRCEEYKRDHMGGDKMAAEWRYTKEGLFELIWEGICVMRAHGEGRHRDGRKIDTRTARLVEQKARAAV